MQTEVKTKAERNAASEINHLTEQISTWFYKHAARRYAVIGISGGKDSTIATALLIKALGKDRVFGVLMPDGHQKDIHDAERVVQILDIPAITVNIGAITTTLENAILDGEHPMKGIRMIHKLSDDTTINIPPRIRMTTLYAVAQSLPDGGIVINTCNESEDTIGYSTKFGDSAGDYAVLKEYTVTELLAIGDVLTKTMGIPSDLIHKAPAAGLSGKTDEDDLGFTYKVLDQYIRYTVLPDDLDTKLNIQRRIESNDHKRCIDLPHPTRYHR